MSDPCASIVGQLKALEADKANLQKELAGAGRGGPGRTTTPSPRRTAGLPTLPNRQGD